MLRHVDRYRAAEVSEKITVSIFRVVQISHAQCRLPSFLNARGRCMPQKATEKIILLYTLNLRF